MGEAKRREQAGAENTHNCFKWKKAERRCDRFAREEIPLTRGKGDTYRRPTLIVDEPALQEQA